MVLRLHVRKGPHWGRELRLNHERIPYHWLVLPAERASLPNLERVFRAKIVAGVVLVQHVIPILLLIARLDRARSDLMHSVITFLLHFID